MLDTCDRDDSAAASAVNEWDRFLATQRPDIGHKQYLWWAEFQKQRGWDLFGVFVRDNHDAICGGATVLVRSFAPGKCYYYVPHGPVLPEDKDDAKEIFEGMVDYIDRHRRENEHLVSHLRLEPRWLERPDYVNAFADAMSWLEPRDTLCIDLAPTEESILAQMKKKGRYNIRLSQRHGISVVEDNSSRGFDDFLRIYRDTAKRQPMRSHSRNYFEILFDILQSDRRGSLFFAEYGGVRLATAMVIYAGDTATYKYGGSLNVHRNVMAPYGLHWEVMRTAKSKGLRWYDFYGLSPKRFADGRWDNFSSFKRRFGGQELNFVPSLDLVYDTEAYVEYREGKTS